MKKKCLCILLINAFTVFSSVTCLAHVPYIEQSDYSEQAPFMITDSIENSKSVYAWFDSGTDIDVYTFELTEPMRLFAEATVPVCPGYEDLLPWLAVVGPGLPETNAEVPFALPAGYGAVVIENLEPGEFRDTFYESFGRKDYYEAAFSFDQEVSTPGTWYIYYWDPYELGGDYVAVIGFREVFSVKDLLLVFVNTPKVWFDRELHTACPQ